jgi:hypothetical protein
MSIARMFVAGIPLVGLSAFAPWSFAQPAPGNSQTHATKNETSTGTPPSVGNAGTDQPEPSAATVRATDAADGQPQPVPPPPQPPTPGFVPARPEAKPPSPLPHPAFSIERETTASRFERSAGISALVLYSGQWGLVAGGSARLLGFFDLAVGYEITPAGKSAMMLAGGLFVFNLNGFDLSLWSMFGGPLVKAEPTAEHPASENRTTPSFTSLVVRVGIPLYARWLPLRIPSTRVIVTYNVLDDGPVKPASFMEKLGVGLEMGLL